MPEYGRGQPTSRKQVDPRDHFSWTTPQLKVSARPTDPYVKPAPSTVDPNLESLIHTVRNLENITNGYVQVQRAYKDENAMKGKADAVQGKAPATEHEGLFNSGYGYQEAYNITQGEAKGLEFRKEYLTKLQENNYFQNAEDPQKAHDEFFHDLYNHHFSAVGQNPQIMFGASEHLKLAQAEGAIAFHKASYDTAKTSFTNAVSQLQQDHLFLYAKGEQSEEDLANLRRILSEDWNLRVKPTNFMTRDQYSQTIINNIGTVALKLAQDPTKMTSDAIEAAYKLVSLFDIPDPDTKQSWSTMVDSEGKLKFRSEIEHFTNRLNAIHNEREQADLKYLKQKQDTEEKDLFANFVINPDVPFEEKRRAILGAKYLTADNIQNLIGKAELFQKEEGWIIEDHRTIVSLRERIELATSNKQLEALRREVIKSYGAVLNSDTAKDLNLRITSREDHLASEGRANRSINLQERQFWWERVKSVVGAATPYDTSNTNGPLRTSEFGKLYFNRLDAGEAPQKAAESLLDYYSQSIGATAEEVFGPAKYSTPEEVLAAAKDGKLDGDTAKIELRKFLQKTK